MLRMDAPLISQVKPAGIGTFPVWEGCRVSLGQSLHHSR